MEPSPPRVPRSAKWAAGCLAAYAGLSATHLVWLPRGALGVTAVRVGLAAALAVALLRSVRWAFVPGLVVVVLLFLMHAITVPYQAFVYTSGRAGSGWTLLLGVAYALVLAAAAALMLSRATRAALG